MRRFFFIILFVVILIAADGCRSRREAHRVTRSDLSLEAVLEARHLDSVSLSDNFFEQLIFEFFPPDSARHAIQTVEGEAVPLGALRRVTVTTGQSSTVTHVVADTASARTEIAEAETKSETVDENSGKKNDFESMVKSIKMLLIGAILAMWVLLCKINEKKNRK